MLPEKGVPPTVVWIVQLDWKRGPQARSSGCETSVAITAECSRHHASWNVNFEGLFYVREDFHKNVVKQTETILHNVLKFKLIALG